MDWNNINLQSNYERNQNILDPLSFETLLLEIQCNVKEINEESIKKQFEDDLKSKIQSAKEIFNSNLKNILEEAKRERNI